MKTIHSRMPAQTQLTLLVLGIVALVLLSFMPTSRIAVVSSETRFAETSTHGLNIIPASCASNPQYFHTDLIVTADGKGFSAPSGASEAGAYAPAAGMYVCVTNATANKYFIPANSTAELQSVKNLGTSIPGLTIW